MWSIPHSKAFSPLSLQLGTWNKVSAVPFSLCLWFSSPASEQRMEGCWSAAFHPCLTSWVPQFGISLSAWISMILIVSLLWNQINKNCAITFMNGWPWPRAHLYATACACMVRTVCIIQFYLRRKSATYWISNISCQKIKVSSGCFLFKLWPSLVFVILHFFLWKKKKNPLPNWNYCANHMQCQWSMKAWMSLSRI